MTTMASAPGSAKVGRAMAVFNGGSLDWFKGKFTGNPWVFTIIHIGLKPVNFPIIQFYERWV